MGAAVTRQVGTATTNQRNKRAQIDSPVRGGVQTKACDIGARAEGLYGSII